MGGIRSRGRDKVTWARSEQVFVLQSERELSWIDKLPNDGDDEESAQLETEKPACEIPAVQTTEFDAI